MTLNNNYILRKFEKLFFYSNNSQEFIVKPLRKLTIFIDFIDHKTKLVTTVKFSQPEKSLFLLKIREELKKIFTIYKINLKHQPQKFKILQNNK